MSNPPHYEISIIICAKNEEKNLTRTIPYWLKLNHNCYQVIVVNDNSTDSTSEILNRFSLLHKNLVHLNTSQNYHHLLGKRAAIATALEYTNSRILMFSDADCIPSNDLILTGLDTKNNVFVGSGTGIYQQKFSISSILNYFEQAPWLVLNKLSWSLGHPLTLTGRAWSCSSQCISIQMLEESNFTISGDDDLLFQAIKKEPNISFEYLPKLITISSPPTSIKEIIQRKTRHISTAKHYSVISQFIFGVVHTELIINILAAITCFIYSDLLFLICWIVYNYLVILIYHIYLKASNFPKLPFLFAPFRSILVLIVHFCISVNRILNGRSKTTYSRMEGRHRNGGTPEKWG